MSHELAALVAFLFLGIFAIALVAVFAMLFRRPASENAIRGVLHRNLPSADVAYLFETQQVDATDLASLSRLGRRIATLRAMGPAGADLSSEAWVEALLAAAEVRRLRVWTVALGLFGLVSLTVAVMALVRTL